MGICPSIAPNLYIEETDKFRKYDKGIVHRLLCSTDRIMSFCTGIENFSSRPCLIRHSEKDYPLCHKTGDLHVIELAVSGNSFPVWVYQFAHEYCHHLIDGDMTGDLSGCIWFEESLCEASSIFNLTEISKQWKASTNPLEYNLANCFQSYADDLTTPRKSNKYFEGLLKSNNYFLITPQGLDYHRDLYNWIAVNLLLPLINENHSLWKIVRHIGDSRKWDSILCLLNHLVDTADFSYKNSVIKLRDSFINI